MLKFKHERKLKPKQLFQTKKILSNMRSC